MLKQMNEKDMIEIKTHNIFCDECGKIVAVGKIGWIDVETKVLCGECQTENETL